MEDDRTNELLKDIIGDAAPSGFRKEALERMVGEAHRRRRIRHLSRALACVAIVCAVSVLFVRISTPQIPPSPTARPANALIVHSRRLAAGMVVRTDSASVSIVKSAIAVATVSSRPAAELFDTIGEGELLALLDGRPAALVRLGPSRSELVLFDRQ